MESGLIADFEHIFLSLIVGAIIGGEREYKSKSAGLRTMIMVSMASCIFTILSLKIGTANPDRLAANILTGLGFLGAGVIFKEDNKVSGITTATTIWITAALGMAFGAGYVMIGALGTILVISVLISFVKIQDKIDGISQIRNYKIVTDFQQETLMKYEQKFKEYKLKALRGPQTKTQFQITGTWVVQGSVKNHERFIQYILNDPEVKEITF